MLAAVRTEKHVASFVPYGLSARLTAADAARETDGWAVTRQILDIPRSLHRALDWAEWMPTSENGRTPVSAASIMKAPVGRF